MAYGIVTCANCSLNRNYAHVFSDDDSAKVNKMILIQDHFFFFKSNSKQFSNVGRWQRKTSLLKNPHSEAQSIYVCVSVGLYLNQLKNP